MKSSVILYKTLYPAQLARLEQAFNVIQVADLSAQTLHCHENDFISAIGLIGAGGKVNSEFLANMPALRAVSTISVGYDNFDVAALSARKIPLMHTPWVLTETVADTAMLLIMMAARRAQELAERVKQGEWQAQVDASWYGVDVHHKTLGIIGMGRIGMALAQRAYGGFSMPVLYHARHQHPDAESRFHARYCDLNTLLCEADIVCSVLPLTDETQNMLGMAQFLKMKPSAIFINIGRGQVVDEKALEQVLRDGKIYAAGLDVYRYEPLPASSPLLALRNVVALPHIGSATHETRYNMDECAVSNLINALQGDLSQNCVNPTVLT